MILSICLNCSLDTRYTALGFSLGEIHSVDAPDITAGGKGLNLARVAAQLDQEVLALGLVGQRDLDFFQGAMTEVGVKAEFIAVPVPTRRCLNIINPTPHCSTEILERGFPVEVKYFEQLMARIRELAPRIKIICASGSVPPGLPHDVYAQLGELARELNKPFILDARGVHLTEGLKSRPFMVKPNLSELETWAGRKLTSTQEILDALVQLETTGVGLPVVSLGSHGAIAMAENLVFQTTAPQVQAVNPVGSGDAFVAGFASGMVQNKNIKDTLRLAAAAGAANALHPHTGHVDPGKVTSLLDKVEIKYWERGK